MTHLTTTPESLAALLADLKESGRHEVFVEYPKEADWQRGTEEGVACLKTPWATIWPDTNGGRFTWCTWDADGVGGENDIADTLEEAMEWCFICAARQGFLPDPLGPPGTRVGVREEWRTFRGTYIPGVEFKDGVQVWPEFDDLATYPKDWADVESERPSSSLPDWAIRHWLRVVSNGTPEQRDGVHGCVVGFEEDKG